MTFIATVVAKKGAVLIADSLVTTSKNVLEFENFSNYLKNNTDPITHEIKINPAEIGDLFSSKPLYTKDYYEKIFQYDKFTAISTAGSAYLNGSSLEQLINEAKTTLKPNVRKSIKIKATELKDFLMEK